jgi:hypothetical protein
MVVLVAACFETAVQSGVTSSGQSPSPSILPSASEPPSSTPAPLPTPRPSLVPFQAPSWQPLVAAGGPSSAVGAVSFQDAYIAFGGGYDRPSWVARSTDGRTWESATLGNMVNPCPEYATDAEAHATAGATDGRQVVLVGIEYAMDIAPCGTQRAVAWVSSDGRRWQRSPGFGAFNGFAEPAGVWPVPGGWEALVRTGMDGPTTLWQSSDGLAWHQTSELVPPGEPGIEASYAAAADGTRVLALFASWTGSAEPVHGLRQGEFELQTSTDGVTWTRLDVTFPAELSGNATSIVAPAAQGPASWLLVVPPGQPDRAISWTSLDLVHWEHAPFPRTSVWDVASTRYGFIATGGDMPDTGGPSSVDPPYQYLSADGLHWTRFKSPVGAWFVVDGPAGVLGFQGDQVWVLEPGS